MTTPTFDIQITTNPLRGYAEIEIYSVDTDADGVRSTNLANSLAVKRVALREPIPGDGDQWFDTGEPEQMAKFATLPDWVRNSALETLAEAFVSLDDNPGGFTTHTNNA